MMKCLSLEARATVVAVASEDLARANAFAARFGIPGAHGNVAELLARQDIDAVYIATFTCNHAEHSIAALAAGKAVLCEKPFAINADQGLRVIQAAKQHRRLFLDAQWTAALPAYRRLLGIARERTLGEPVLLQSEFGLAHDPASHARLFEGEGAGVLLDFGVYPIVLALQALGPVSSVTASVQRNAAGVDVHASLQLVHANGSHSQLAISLIATLPNRTSLSCTGGAVQLESPVMGAETLDVRVTSPKGAADAGGDPEPRLVAALRRTRWLRRLRASLSRRRGEDRPYGANRYSPQLSHFISLLDSGALDSDVMPHATSLDVLRIIDAARLAPGNAATIT